MKRDFWGIDGEIWGWNWYIISNFHSLQNRTNVQTKGGGGSKAFWTMFKKTALFLMDGFPNFDPLAVNYNWNTLHPCYLPSDILTLKNMSPDYQREESTYKGSLSPGTPSIKTHNHHAWILTPEHSLTMTPIPRPNWNVSNRVSHITPFLNWATPY